MLLRVTSPNLFPAASVSVNSMIGSPRLPRPIRALLTMSPERPGSALFFTTTISGGVGLPFSGGSMCLSTT